MNNFKYAGYLFFGMAILIFLLGASTYLWIPVNAKVSSINAKNICVAGYSNVKYPGVPQIKSEGCYYISVDYHFTVAKQFYSNSFIGFYIPINIDLEPVGAYKAYTAYYLPGFPEFSVIKRGFGWGLVLIFLFLGSSCLYVRRQILSYVAVDS